MNDATVRPHERFDASPPFVSPPPIPPTPESTFPPFYPCRGDGYHDFAVGETVSVCNRCEKVVRHGTS